LEAKIQKINKLNDDARLYFISQILALFALLTVLKLGLLPALLSGLLIYQLVQVATGLLSKVGIAPSVGKLIAVIIIAIIVMSSITLGAMGLTSFLDGSSDSLIALLQKMADVIDTIMGHLPISMREYLPTNVVDVQVATAAWLREHAVQLSHIGKEIGTSMLYILTGMIIGGMIAVSNGTTTKAPLTSLLTARVALLSSSFRRIVFSQVKISAINTSFTALFLVVILPLFGVHLPLTKTMIAVTFIVGLLPVIGNLISNTVIVLISLGVSAGAAFGALAFLITIHKLEYFLNAHIIGINIRARAWEILLSMLVMEAAFGMAGVIAAPIYYAYLKDELSARKLI
jgi:predicted PurR-regulated permease PerM